MRSQKYFASLIIGSLVVASAVACSSDEDPVGGTGGTTATGGGTSTGGGLSTGGGTAATGGGTSTGGVAAGTGGAAPGGGDYFEGGAAGLDGAFVGVYSYNDTGGSTVTVTNPEPGKVCAAGTAIAHMEMYTTNWGGGVGFALVDEAGKATGMDVSSATGISFTITGLPPGDFRVGLLQAADQENTFFQQTTVLTEGANTIPKGDLMNGEWVTPAGTLDLTTITDLQFQVASVATDTPFDFCLSNVKLDGVMIGGGGAGGQ